MLEDLIVHSAVCLSEVCIVYLSGRLLLCQDWVLGREVLGSIHPLHAAFQSFVLSPCDSGRFVGINVAEVDTVVFDSLHCVAVPPIGLP